MGCFLWLCLLIRIIIYVVAWWGLDHRLIFCHIHLSSNKPKISSFKTLPRSSFLKWGQWEMRILEKKVGHATWIIKEFWRRGKINIPFYLGVMLNHLSLCLLKLLYKQTYPRLFSLPITIVKEWFKLSIYANGICSWICWWCWISMCSYISDMVTSTCRLPVWSKMLWGFSEDLPTNDA